MRRKKDGEKSGIWEASYIFMYMYMFLCILMRLHCCKFTLVFEIASSSSRFVADISGHRNTEKAKDIQAI